MSTGVLFVVVLPALVDDAVELVEPGEGAGGAAPQVEPDIGLGYWIRMTIPMPM